MNYALMVLALAAGGEYSPEVLPFHQCVDHAVIITREVFAARANGGFVEVEKKDGTTAVIIGAYCREIDQRAEASGK